MACQLDLNLRELLGIGERCGDGDSPCCARSLTLLVLLTALRWIGLAVVAVAAVRWALRDFALKSACRILRLFSRYALGRIPWWGDYRIFLNSVRLTLLEGRARWTRTAEQVAAMYLGPAGGGALASKVAVVTGSTSGIGLETARVLLSHGCHVVLAVRSVDKGEAVLEALRASLRPTCGENLGEGTVMRLDTADLDSVRAFAEEFRRSRLRLDYLVLNAGIMCKPEKEVSKHGYELCFNTNHLGHFLLQRLLEQTLLQSGIAQEPSRLVIISSCANWWWLNVGLGEAGGWRPGLRLVDQVPPTRPWEPLAHYGLSKALNLMTAVEQQRRWGAHAPAVAAAVHPGVIATNILSSQEEMENFGVIFGWPYFFWQKTVEQGASTTLHACLAPEVPRLAQRGEVFFQNNAPMQCNVNPLCLEPGVATEAWRRSEELVAPWLKETDPVYTL